MIFVIVVYFLIVFTILVLAHEWGHFIAAKKQGLTVYEFGFGFPPRLFSRMWHGTLYSLNLFPLGGFVRIKGEEGEGADDRDSFAHCSVWRRALIIVAGVALNVVLGWVLLTGGLLIGTPLILHGDIPSYAVRERSLVIRSVLPNAPATTIDLRLGDAIVRVEDRPIATLRDLQDILADRDGKETAFALKRGDAFITHTITPRYLPEAKRVGIGVGLEEIGVVRYPLLQGIARGSVMTVTILRDILVAFWGLLRDLVVTQRVTVDLSGPVGIAVLTGSIARQGVMHLIQFTALLSLNLAVLNVLPIPALDGGRLFFLLLEKIRRKPIRKETEALVHRIGFLLLLLLVLLVTYKDIVRLF